MIDYLIFDPEKQIWFNFFYLYFESNDFSNVEEFSKKNSFFNFLDLF